MRKIINDMKKYWNYTIYAAKSQLKTEVANSYLNWLWWVLEPFCFMLIYSFVFGFLFKKKQLYFNVYIFLGLALWDFFNRCIKSSVRMVKRNKAIVSKVYLPKYTLVFSDMLVNAFKMLICFGIVLVMLIVNRVPITYNIVFAIPIIAITMLLTFGLACVFLHLGVFIEDMSNVINIVLRFVFYLTGIFYNINDFPKPYSTLLLKFNPMACLIDNLRQCVMYGKAPDFKVLICWFIAAVLISWFGILNIYRNENTYVKVI